MVTDGEEVATVVAAAGVVAAAVGSDGDVLGVFQSHCHSRWNWLWSSWQRRGGRWSAVVAAVVVVVPSPVEDGDALMEEVAFSSSSVEAVAAAAGMQPTPSRQVVDRQMGQPRTPPPTYSHRTGPFETGQPSQAAALGGKRKPPAAARKNRAPERLASLGRSLEPQQGARWWISSSSSSCLSCRSWPFSCQVRWRVA